MCQRNSFWCRLLKYERGTSQPASSRLQTLTHSTHFWSLIAANAGAKNITASFGSFSKTKKVKTMPNCLCNTIQNTQCGYLLKELKKASQSDKVFSKILLDSGRELLQTAWSNLNFSRTCTPHQRATSPSKMSGFSHHDAEECCNELCGSITKHLDISTCSFGILEIKLQNCCEK